MQGNPYDRRTNVFSSGNTNSRNVPSLGSNRLDYVKDDLGRLKGVIEKWKDEFPFSITCRLQTLHLSPTELRIEDYYLMRKGQLRAHQMDRVKEAIRNQNFNEQLLKADPMKLPPVSSERSLDLDSIRDQIRMASGASSNNSTNFFASNSSNSNNVFSRNNQQSGNNSNSSGNNSNNCFMNTSNSNSSNIFGRNQNRGNSGNSSSNAIFGGNNGGSSGNSMFNGNNSSNSSNMFGNNQNNSSNNIFNRGNTQNSNNIFGNSSNNNSNNNNSNSNSNNLNTSNNVFNQNRNNSQSAGNNIFNNQSGGNRNSGNSLFNQNTNNNNNNQFNQNNNNNNNFGNNLFNMPTNSNISQQLQFMVSSLHHYFQQTQKYMTKLQECFNSHHPSIDQGSGTFICNSQKESGPKENEIFSYSNYQLPEWDKRQPQVIIVKPQKQKRTLFYPQKPQPKLSYQSSQNSSPIGKPIQSQYVKQQSSNQKNSRFSQMQSINPYQGSMINSKIRSRELKFEGQCQVDIRLEVHWVDIQDSQSNRDKRIKIDILDGIEIIQAKGIKINSLDLESKQGRSQFIKNLTQTKKYAIRTDAVLHVDRRNTQILVNQKKVVIVGRIKQKLVNISQGYDVFYTKINAGNIYDFTISRKGVGTVSWDDPIPYQALDFHREDEGFSLERDQFSFGLSVLQSQFRITFTQLPPEFMKILQEKGVKEAKNKLDQFIKANFGDKIKLLQLRQNGEWCLMYCKQVKTQSK